ncbi:indolepyruvate ferredoxin oxidoreductase subunit alpha [Thermodesulfobacterium sp. TA1]|uniref:thiamine pyrophosphate-dependent enzyme n=1 Tax=Thermodesulfobacterium sp. TA1 TaxID=2234087 RepID=UPI001231BA6F|nr:thiamine pyrophosphate-dependent enzyme [Thermodesulfobacterium sp. TA1]QER42791.1 indolepyruvate ferredoxin oxidoreductase subunit alpha [Thermodesulfobacterium sp. TA1]
MHPILKGENCKKFLLGNEAIVRAAVESCLQVGAAYPGTPSSEIGNNLFQLQKDLAGLYFEFAVNEKVAMEIVGAASACGLRSLTCMKHVGLNVASDAFMTLAYVGVEGGLVVVTADDPSCHSSQNEQDNRYYAKLAQVPMFEAYNPQTAYLLTKEAFSLSERFKLPVVLRTTTRVSHARGQVEVETVPFDFYQTFKKGFFKKDPFRFVPVPAVARKQHKLLLEKLEEMQNLASSFSLNQFIPKGKLGVCASGVAVNYVLDALEDLGLIEDVSLLILTFTHPFPEKLALDFLSQVETCVVVEELEPYLEDNLKVISYTHGLKTKILGKKEKLLPRYFEFTPTQVKEALAKAFNIKGFKIEVPPFDFSTKLPARPPVLCPGCPHRETYKLIKEVLQEMGIEEHTIYPTDIGCYTLGIQPPINMADYLLCMGSSVGTPCGFDVATDQRVVAFIGDSTFFHAGLSPLVNAKFNKHNFTLVVLDNDTTAMTGHQPVPSQTIKSPIIQDHPIIPIKKIVDALDIPCVEINPYKKEEAKELIQPLFEKRELSVIISKAPCILYKTKSQKGS